MRKIAHLGMDAVASLPEDSKRWLWIGLLIASTFAFTLVFACATPFAALATLAALNMRGRDAVILTFAVWFTNQAVGFGILHYPQTYDAFSWAAYMGFGAALALIAAWGAVRLSRFGSLLTTILALAAAFVAYQVALYPASLTLEGGDLTYTWYVLQRVLEANAIAMVGLLLLHRAAVTIGLVVRNPGGATASTA